MLFDFTKQELPEPDFTLAKAQKDLINQWYNSATSTNIYWSTDSNNMEVMCIKFNADGSFGPTEYKTIPDTGNTITVNDSSTFFYSIDFRPLKSTDNTFKTECTHRKSLDVHDDIMVMNDDDFYEWDTQHAEPYDYDENDPMWF